MMNFDIAVIGGGASGLAAAVSAARMQRGGVCVLERQPRVGKKLLATGNGRCNLYNVNAGPEAYFASHAFTGPALRAFHKGAAEKFFASLGIETREYENGNMYPMSNQASAVLDCLRISCAEAGVMEITDFEAARIKGGAGAFTIQAKSGEAVSAKRVIVAAGGAAAPKLGGSSAYINLLRPLGHTFAPAYPALTPLALQADSVNGLKGLKYQGEIALLVQGQAVSTETGEILFTENGISGIAAMQLSLRAAAPLATGKTVKVRMALLPMTADEAEAFLRNRIKMMSKRPLEEFLTGVLSKRVGQLALKRAGIFPLSRPAGTLSEAEIRRAAKELTQWECAVVKTGSYEQAQVMLGGANTSEFEKETLESRLVPGLYAAGELLDVTGPCGGYNLAWAWASGILAGRSAAKSL